MTGLTPWELYEQVKKVLREVLGDDVLDPGQPFVLTCHHCGLPFRKDLEMGMIAAHAEAEHGWDGSTGPLQMDLVWVGEGPPPPEVSP